MEEGHGLTARALEAYRAQKSHARHTVTKDETTKTELTALLNEMLGLNIALDDLESDGAGRYVAEVAPGIRVRGGLELPPAAVVGGTNRLVLEVEMPRTSQFDDGWRSFRTLDELGGHLDAALAAEPA